MAAKRLDFEIDTALEPTLVTARAGVPGLIEAFRFTGAAAVVDETVCLKSRKRGLSASQMVESVIALVVSGGERVEDMDRLRQDEALAVLLGYPLPAAQTLRDFLASFGQEDVPLLAQADSKLEAESPALSGLGSASREPQAVATIDIDASIIVSAKKAAKLAYTGETGYQPVIALWAEQDVILADEFRDGNVPAGTGNLRIARQAVAALPAGIDTILLRGDSALYDNELLSWLEDQGIGYGVSADLSASLKRHIKALPESAWRLEDEADPSRGEWAEVAYVPDDNCYKAGQPQPFRRYLLHRRKPAQTDLINPAQGVHHFAMVTNRADPEGGSGLDLLRWHRLKAGSVEHAHAVLGGELAGRALPSQNFAANAAWFRLNILTYNLLSAYKRIGLTGELHTAKPKRLRFLLFNTVGKVVRHARETLLRFAQAQARTLADTARLAFALPRPALPGV